MILRQINFRLAVYVCQDKICPYPEGRDYVEIEQRYLKDLSKEIGEQSTENTDLDLWLRDFFAGEDKKEPVENRRHSTVNDDDLLKMIDEISKSQNESDLDLQYDRDLFTWIDDAFDQFGLDGTPKDENTNVDIDKVSVNPTSIESDIEIIQLDEDLMSKNIDPSIDIQPICNEFKMECDKTLFCNNNSNTINIPPNQGSDIKEALIYKEDNKSDTRIIPSLNEHLIGENVNPPIDAQSKSNEAKIESENNNGNKTNFPPPTKYRILNFEQGKDNDDNDYRHCNPINENTKDSNKKSKAFVPSKLTPHMPKQLILNGQSTSTRAVDRATSKESNKFANFKYINVLVKAGNK